jgi:hypothetical protein
LSLRLVQTELKLIQGNPKPRNFLPCGRDHQNATLVI